MFRKSVWLPILSALLFVIGCGLFYGRKVANQEPIKVYKPVDVKKKPVAPKPPPPGETYETGHWHGDEWHSEPHETHAPTPPQADAPVVEAQAPQPRGYPPLPPSSVPVDIPEHLKFPDELRIPYYSSHSKGPPPVSSAEAQRLLSMLREIARDYNPKRPIGDIWDQFIEYEKMYRAYAEQDLNKTPFSIACNRADWQYEQMWAFPEIMGVFFLADATEDEKHMLFTAKSIAMGEESPDWNEHILHDGRAFYLRYDTRYKFKWTTPEGVERTTTFSRTLDKSAPLVVIYPDTTSDEELKRLGWWNFHINPYTLEPVNYQPYPIRN